MSEKVRNGMIRLTRTGEYAGFEWLRPEDIRGIRNGQVVACHGSHVLWLDVAETPDEIHALIEEAEGER